MKRIHESDNWVVDILDDGRVRVSYFSNGHYKDEITLDIAGEGQHEKED